MLRQHCNDLPIPDEKLQTLCSINDSDYDTSSEEEELKTQEDVKNPNCEEDILSECNSIWANSVQVILLGGKLPDLFNCSESVSFVAGSKKTKSLEKKVEMAAEGDVALSQELLVLKNQIFLKTKQINDLKNEVDRLKDEAETQIFGP